METSESLSIESFSYSWLVNTKPSLESQRGSFRASFDEFDESSFIEMDPNLSASKRFVVFHQDFDFDLPTLQPSCVDADELMSNGILVPFFLKPMEIGIYDSDDSNGECVAVSAMRSQNPCSYRRSRSFVYRRYGRLPKRVMRKYLNVLRLIWIKIRTRRCDGGSEGKKMIEPCGRISDQWSGSWTLSPTTSKVSVMDNWRTSSCDSDASIYEAVLHCKKTIGCD